MDDLELSLQNSMKSFSAKPLVLVVDDDEDSLLLVTCLLDLLDCSCLTAKDGRMALTLAQSHRPDLILLDMLLPHLSGLEVVSQLKQHPQTRAIPVVALTALATEADRDRILLAGCDDYLSKPYMIDDLEATICGYLSLTITAS